MADAKTTGLNPRAYITRSSKTGPIEGCNYMSEKSYKIKKVKTDILTESHICLEISPY